jgi:alpha-tubulin suppressor-like RCC1 family protein
VATAGPHSLALKRDGTLWSWGNNWAGQLGDGTTNHSRVPVRVGSSTNWTRVWANLIQNVGQQSDGSLWFWGWDYTRSSKGSSIPVPTRVSPDTNWVDVGMGDWMAFAIKSDGTLWAWGRQAHIYTGASTANADSSPVRVGGNSDWRACAKFSQSCPILMKRDGSLWIIDGSDRRGVAAVTAIVSGLVTNNQLNCIADSTTLGGDPAFGVVKRLQITFKLGGTNQVLTFKENSTVSLGGAGLSLAITRALYGDPRLFSNAAALLSPPARFHRVQLSKDVVAFCGGRHLLAAALTSEGEVWTWGEALGQHTPAIPPLQWVSRLLNRIGAPARFGDPGPVTHQEPWRLQKFDAIAGESQCSWWSTLIRQSLRPTVGDEVRSL